MKLKLCTIVWYSECFNFYEYATVFDCVCGMCAHALVRAHILHESVMSLSCKQLFSVANQLLGNKKPSPLPAVFPLIDLPKCFLDFFKDKIETVRNKLVVLSSNPLACTEFSFHGRPLTHFRPVTEDFVRCTILSSPLKTCELDAFPTLLLLECLDSLLPCITAVFNSSLVSGVFPSVYKSALVKPLLKKMSLDPDDLKNYRPVSNLYFVSKVLES